MKRIPFTLSVFVLLGMASAVQAADILTPDQIKATFITGVPFTAEAMGGKTKTITLNPDGSAKIVAKGKKTGQTGKWRLSTDGYCSTWDKGTENCYLIKKSGTKYDVMTPKKVVVA